VHWNFLDASKASCEVTSCSHPPKAPSWRQTIASGDATLCSNIKLEKYTNFNPCMNNLHVMIIQSFLMHAHIYSISVCVCAQHHLSQYKSTHHTIRCWFISNTRFHQQSVPSHLHYNPNLPHFVSLSYLNLYQMLKAYSLLTAVNCRYTTWQLKRNLTFNKQANISLKAKSFV